MEIGRLFCFTFFIVFIKIYRKYEKVIAFYVNIEYNKSVIERNLKNGKTKSRKTCI